MKTPRLTPIWLMESLLLALTIILCSIVARAEALANPGRAPLDPSGLKWAADVLEQTVPAGQAKARFQFWFTNESSSEVLIESARSSCFCTVAALPSTPWRIPPGTNVYLEVNMDLAGKHGIAEKPIYVQTSRGPKTLTARAHIPDLRVSSGFAVVSDDARLRNLQAALADRQKVFRDQACAKCHADPAHGQTDGAKLYAAVCAICHDSTHRAAMVPDLRTLRSPIDAEHWRSSIGQGRPGSLMPAFAESAGGPLNDQQIEAVVHYLMTSARAAVDTGAPRTASAAP